MMWPTSFSAVPIYTTSSTCVDLPRSIFPQVQTLVARGARRRLPTYREDGARETAWFSGHRCNDLSIPPPASPKQPRKRPMPVSDAGQGQVISVERQIAQRQRPCKQPHSRHPRNLQQQRRALKACDGGRAASSVEETVEEDVRWRDEATGRALSHGEAIRLYEPWGLKCREKTG